jgi:hypothetical protein
MKYYCNNCQKEVELDQNARCTSCEAEYLVDIVAAALAEDSSKDNDDILMFVHDDIDGDCVNKKNLLHKADGHTPIGPTVPVLRVSAEFFKMLTPDKHDRTKPNSPYGKVIIKNEPPVMQLILKELRRHAVPYKELTSKKEAYRRVVPRGKLLVDNELFVDFD